MRSVCAGNAIPSMSRRSGETERRADKLAAQQPHERKVSRPPLGARPTPKWLWVVYPFLDQD